MPLNWGILTAGNIAGKFAAGIGASRTGRLVATGARDLSRAEEFAKEWGGKAYGSYQEVLDDPDVQAVYIATPHHLHAEWTAKAALAGKAILCEKPFALNAMEAEVAIGEVRRAGVFFMEAFMYRCSLQTRKLVSLLNDGVIGKVRAVSAEFSFGAGRDWDNFRTDGAIGGGGIMDVGSYCASFARLVAGEEPDRVEYTANLDPGYDAYGVGVLHFPGGLVAKVGSGVHLWMRNDAIVYGEEGMIRVEDPWKSSPGTTMTLSRQGSAPEVFSLGCSDVELYASEADAVRDFLARGECPYMSIDDTLGNMHCLDQMRASCGLKFALES